jgi:uncharacterized protein (DUF1778 family)
MPVERSSILIRCTRDEAELIRRIAKKEHRTLSGFALNAILKHIANRQTKDGEVTQGQDEDLLWKAS